MFKVGDTIKVMDALIDKQLNGKTAVILEVMNPTKLLKVRIDGLLHFFAEYEVKKV